MQQGNESVISAAEAIVAAELQTGDNWRGELEIPCPECGLEFQPAAYVAHVNDPGSTHAEARALRLLDDWTDANGPTFGEQVIASIAAESGASPTFVRRAARDLV